MAKKKSPPSGVVAVIPARYGSTRFEGKPLADILGKPMIQWVYEGVCEAQRVDEVMVATDDERIRQAVLGFGGRAVMTSSAHRTGTDRVAEVARRLRAEIVVNVQGDEPLIKGSLIDRAVELLLSDKETPMASLMTPMREVREWLNPNVAKVVVDQDRFALYFSRSPIPFPRDLRPEITSRRPFGNRKTLPHTVFKHIGLYVYRRPFLLRFSQTEPTPLEQLEKLEQLRALEKGYRIKMAIVNYEPVCVDTPEDLEKVIAVIKKERNKGSGRVDPKVPRIPPERAR